MADDWKQHTSATMCHKHNAFIGGKSIQGTEHTRCVLLVIWPTVGTIIY